MNSMSQAVLERMSEVLRRPVQSLDEGVELTSVAPDSFALVEMIIDLQDEFGVRMAHEDLVELRTVGDVVRFVEQRSAA